MGFVGLCLFAAIIVAGFLIGCGIEAAGQHIAKAIQEKENQ